MKQFSKYCFSYVVNSALLLRISASRSLLTLARAESMSPLELKRHLYGLHPEKTSEFTDSVFRKLIFCIVFTKISSSH